MVAKAGDPGFVHGIVSLVPHNGKPELIATITVTGAEATLATLPALTHSPSRALACAETRPVAARVVIRIGS